MDCQVFKAIDTGGKSGNEQRFTDWELDVKAFACDSRVRNQDSQWKHFSQPCSGI